MVNSSSFYLAGLCKNVCTRVPTQLVFAVDNRLPHVENVKVVEKKVVCPCD